MDMDFSILKKEIKEKKKSATKLALEVCEVLKIPTNEESKGLINPENSETFSINLTKSEVEEVYFFFEVTYLQHKEKDEDSWYQPRGKLYLEAFKEPVECFLHGIHSNKFQKVGNIIGGRLTNGKMTLILKEEGDGFTP